MTKEEALASLAKVQKEAESLKEFIAAQEKQNAAGSSLIARRFTTNDAKTGVYLSIPSSVPNPSMPIMGYLIREFMDRGGKVYDAENRIKRWSAMRFVVRGGLCDAWKGGAAKTFCTLAKQPTVGDLLGQSFVWLVDTSGDIETHAGESFDDLMEAGVDVLNPMAFVALFLTAPDIADPATYTSFKGWRWEWVAGLLEIDDEVFAAGGYSRSVGLSAGWGAPGSSYSDGRARPVVR